MKRDIFIIGVVFLLFTQLLVAKNSTTIGSVIYQNQAFTSKDKQIFDRDAEGLRVWSWGRAEQYCDKLKLDGYAGWRVASRSELKAIMTQTPSKGGLFINKKFTSTVPKSGGKYDDVWMWSRESRSRTIGTFVNFKKATDGFADKSYKGYVICTRAVDDSSKGVKPEKLKRAVLFEYRGEIWRSDMTPRGTKALGDYGLSHFKVCHIVPIMEGGNMRNVDDQCSDDPSGFVQLGNYSYFFAHKGSSKTLNIYRTDGTKKGTRKIASLGKKVAYMPMVVSRNLYFMLSSYVPFQTEPPDRELWVVDMKRAKAKEIVKLDFDTSINGSNYFSMYASSKNYLFLQAHHYDEQRNLNNRELWIVEKNNKSIQKLKEFKDEILQNLSSIKVFGVTNKLTKIPNNSSFGWERYIPKDEFSIKEGSLLYRGVEIAKLSKIKGLAVDKVKILYNGKKEVIFESASGMWGVYSEGRVIELK